MPAAIARAMGCPVEEATRRLDGWMAARRVIALTWLDRILLPSFQFDFVATVVRPFVDPVLCEFEAIFDEWETVEWFVTPNLWLADNSPAQMAMRDPPAIVGAARADRCLLTGSRGN